jgi:hypothetical protein
VHGSVWVSDCVCVCEWVRVYMVHRISTHNPWVCMMRGKCVLECECVWEWECELSFCEWVHVLVSEYECEWCVFCECESYVCINKESPQDECAHNQLWFKNKLVHTALSQLTTSVKPRALMWYVYSGDVHVRDNQQLKTSNHLNNKIML